MSDKYYSHCINKKGRLDVHTLCEQEGSRPTQYNDKGDDK